MRLKYQGVELVWINVQFLCMSSHSSKEGEKSKGEKSVCVEREY